MNFTNIVSKVHNGSKSGRSYVSMMLKTETNRVLSARDFLRPPAMMRLSEQVPDPNAGGKSYQSRLENIKYTPVGGAPLDAPAYPNAAK